MTDDLDNAALKRLRTELGPDSPLLAYAAAVVRHLTTPPAPPAQSGEVIDRVVRVLRQSPDRSEDASPEWLIQDPELLASFFQNADLLDPHTPEALSVTVMVMRAIEAAGGTRP